VIYKLLPYRKPLQWCDYDDDDDDPLIGWNDSFQTSINYA
jgi:hypothetical protein